MQVLPRLPVDGVCELSTAYIIIDGMAIVQMVRSAGSATFGELAQKYFNFITAKLGRMPAIVWMLSLIAITRRTPSKQMNVPDEDHLPVTT